MLLETDQLLKLNLGEPEVVQLKSGRTFVGNGVAFDLEPNEHQFVAEQIHALTLDNPETMEPVSVESLLTSMKQGKTVLRLGDNNEVLAFARLSEDKLAEGIYDPTTIVVGTLLGVRHAEYTNGSGAWAMENAAELALSSLKFLGALRVITRIHVANQGPQNMLKKFGDKVEEEARGIISPNTKKPVNVYDITKLGRSRIT